MSKSYSMEEILQEAEKVAIQFDLDPALFKAILVAENSDKGQVVPNKQVASNTTSHARAFGVGQVIPATFEGLKRLGYLPKDAKQETLQEQLAASAAAIKEKQHLYKTKDPLRVAMAYNGNRERNVKYDKTGDMNVFTPETKHYVNKVATAYKNFRGTAMPASTSSSTSAASSTSSSRKVYPPGTVEEITAMVEDFAAQRGSVTDILNTIIGGKKAAAEQGMAGIEKLSAAEKTAITAKQAVDQKAAEQTAHIANFFGVDSRDPSARIVAEQARELQANQILQSLQPEVDRIAAINPLTDPMGWLMGQFKKNQLAEQWNAAARMKDVATGNIQRLQYQAQAQKNLLPDIAATEQAALANAEIEASAARALIEKAKLQAATFGDQLTYLQTERAWSGDIIGYKLAVAKLTAETIAAREALSQKDGISTAPVKLTKEEEDELALVNQYVGMFGQQPYTAQLFKSLGKDERTKLILAARAGNGSMGATPGAALVTAIEQSAIPSIAQTNRTRANFLRDFHAQAQLKSDEMDAKDVRGVRRKLSAADRIQTAADELVTDWRNELRDKPRDKLPDTNPYAMQSGLYALAPALADNPIAQEAAKRMGANQKMTDKEIVDYAKSLVLAKTVTPEQAVDLLHDWYIKGARHQDELLGLASLGIDLTDPKSVKGELAHRLSSEIFVPVNRLHQLVGAAASGFPSPLLAAERATRAFFTPPESGNVNVHDRAALTNFFYRSIVDVMQQLREMNKAEAAKKQKTEKAAGGETPSSYERDPDIWQAYRNWQAGDRK